MTAEDQAEDGRRWEPAKTAEGRAPMTLPLSLGGPTGLTPLV